jgi:ketosteroid isomerase-like protein
MMVMKKPLLCFAILCLVFNPVTSRADARKEVEQAFNRFITAFNNLDWEQFRSAFGDEVTVFNPDIPEVPSVGRLDGRQQVEEVFRSVFAAGRKQTSGPPYLHIEPRRVQIQMLGEVAIVSFEFDREGGTMGRRTIIFHREGGTWKIVHIHASNVIKRG